MISKRHCPHTGIVNFFASADPLIAIGSVSEATGAPSYAWRCYLDDPVGGIAPDIVVAEAELRAAIASRRRSPASSP
jgi:hypothetical protein